MGKGRIPSGLKRALVAGTVVVVVVVAAAPFVKVHSSKDVADSYRSPHSPEARENREWAKDQGRYYGSAIENELKKRAEDGDEWAMREVRWPRDHKFHKLGRPFHRNDKPHPEGLFPYSGY